MGMKISASTVDEKREHSSTFSGREAGRRKERKERGGIEGGG